jgi:hypothetical protein
MILAPAIFVVWIWATTHGFPYFKDSNESYLSHNHARNMFEYDPWAASWLTVEDVTNKAPPPVSVYAHNPNFPRYVHAALMAAGIESLSWAILLIAVPVTLLSMVLL